MRPYHLLLLGLLVFASCVPNKKITLLQKGDLNKSLPEDTTLRTYALDTFQYKIQPNDVLIVRFQSLTPPDTDPFRSQGPNQNTNVQAQNAGLAGDLVDENGNLTFPVVGKVKVAGLTVFQVQEKLQEIASQYIEGPVVKVRLVNFRITVLGEVNNEGTITFTNNRVSMIEAIAQAGGLGELADRENIKLIRQVGSRTEVQYINLLEEDFFTSPYFYVNQNDVLVVPPLKQRAFRRYFGTNVSLIVSTISLILIAINLTR